MCLETAFRLSSYLTLGLACVCLGYAEQSFLGGIIFWEASLLVLLPIAFWAEGRVSLPIWAANVLGVFIAGGMGLWVASRIIGSDDPMVDIAPWPASLLPYLGPLLMVLMMVKLFRPKQAGDSWMLHAIGLMPGMDVIDLCSGDGWFTLQIARIARHVLAIDLDASGGVMDGALPTGVRRS